MRWRLSLFIVFAASLAGHLSDTRAQSLADVARQEEERRRAIKAEAKVYTNKDLRPVASAPSSPSDAGAASAVPSGTPTQMAPDGGAPSGKKAPSPDEPDLQVGQEAERDQAHWNGRLKGLQADLDRDQTYLDALQSRINALTTDFVNRDDPAQRAVIASDRQKAIAEFERLKKQIQEDRAAIVNLQEEARRAGVPPGWLR